MKITNNLLLWFIFFTTIFPIAGAETIRTEPCLKWKRVCYQKEHCTQRESGRASCYRCVRQQHYGFHLYPRQIDRNTCNFRTAHYLVTMGYRCYQPYGSPPCNRTAKSEFCDWRCEAYAN